MRRPFRIHRLLAQRFHAISAWMLVLSLLFAQGALAAYRCPMEQSSGTAITTAPCHGHPAQTQDPLCSAHCDPQAAATDIVKLPVFLASGLPALPPATLQLAQVAIRIELDAEQAHHAGAPPIPIRFLALLN